MTAAASQSCDGLFNGGPPRRLEMFVGLARKSRPDVLRLETFVICAGWLPLVVLVAVQSLAAHDGSLDAFISDYGIQARSLIAAPLFVIAEAISAPRLGRIVAQFISNGLIAEEDQTRFAKIVSSTQRLRDSVEVEIAAGLIALSLGIMLVFLVPPDLLPAWHGRPSANGHALSAAGWWNDLVTAPLLLLLVFGWLWRVAIWGRFLVLVSRLRLKLVPTHPDRLGGLGFLEISLQSFSLFGFGIAVILAGSMANRVMHESRSIASFQYAVAGFEIVMLCIVVGPLFAFSAKIMEAWREGIFAYGAFACAMGSRLERKWFQRAPGDEMLQAPDFSSTTDLYSVVSNVYAIRFIPVSIMRLGTFVAATMLPFLPVLLMSLPLSFILKKIVAVVL